jgi:hypothetical protein
VADETVIDHRPRLSDRFVGAMSGQSFGPGRMDVMLAHLVAAAQTTTSPPEPGWIGPVVTAAAIALAGTIITVSVTAYMNHRRTRENAALQQSLAGQTAALQEKLVAMKAEYDSQAAVRQRAHETDLARLRAEVEDELARRTESTRKEEQRREKENETLVRLRQAVDAAYSKFQHISFVCAEWEDDDMVEECGVALQHLSTVMGFENEGLPDEFPARYRTVRSDFVRLFLTFSVNRPRRAEQGKKEEILAAMGELTARKKDLEKAIQVHTAANRL